MSDGPKTEPNELEAIIADLRRIGTEDGAYVEMLAAADVIEALAREREAVSVVLSDPNDVHINMMQGRIANPSVAQIVHIYAGKVQAVSDEPVTVQAAAKVLAGDKDALTKISLKVSRSGKIIGYYNALLTGLRAISGEKP